MHPPLATRDPQLTTVYERAKKLNDEMTKSLRDANVTATSFFDEDVVVQNSPIDVHDDELFADLTISSKLTRITKNHFT